MMMDWQVPSLDIDQQSTGRIFRVADSCSTSVVIGWYPIERRLN